MLLITGISLLKRRFSGIYCQKGSKFFRILQNVIYTN